MYMVMVLCGRTSAHVFAVHELFFVLAYCSFKRASSCGVPRSSYSPSLSTAVPKNTGVSCCHSMRMDDTRLPGIRYVPFGFLFVSLLSAISFSSFFKSFDIILREPDQPRDPRSCDQHHQDGLCCTGELPKGNADQDVPAQ